MPTKVTGPGGSTDTTAETTSRATGVFAHAEGYAGVASGIAAHAEGQSATASGNYSHAEGNSTTASAADAHAEGNGGTATGQDSHAGGYFGSATRWGQWARGGGIFSAAGDVQASMLVLMAATGNATPQTMVVNGGGSGTYSGAQTNVWTVGTNRAHRFRISVVARRSDTPGEAAGWELSGLVTRESGNVRLVGAVTGSSWGDAAAAAWDVTVAVDTSNQALRVTVTGEAGKTIRWAARIDTVEMNA